MLKTAPSTTDIVAHGFDENSATLETATFKASTAKKAGGGGDYGILRVSSKGLLTKGAEGFDFFIGFEYFRFEGKDVRIWKLAVVQGDRHRTAQAEPSRCSRSWKTSAL